MEAKFRLLVKKLASIEMKFFRRTARYTLFYYKRNDEILKEFKVEPVDKKRRIQK
jgi:hypothetical protein